MFKKILLPTDGSDHSLKAADIALKLAQDQNAQVTILNVVSIPDKTINLVELFPEVDGVKFEERFKKKGQEIIARTAAAFEKANFSYSARVEFGSPAEIICQILKEEGFDLVIIGSHGHSLARLIMGSVCTGVANCAPCPVMIVH